MSTAIETSETPLTGAPACPKCTGRMWDNRASKRNPKAPDFKCRDRSCDEVLWPGQHNAAKPIMELRSRQSDEAAPADETSSPTEQSAKVKARTRLQECYLALTDFVLAGVRPKYQEAGVPCTDATVAAIAATLFIATCRQEGN
jgi:hypothetical protein